MQSLVLGKASEERSASIQQRIRQAAKELVTELGTENVTTQEVARRAQLSVTTLYRHFHGGSSLLAALQNDEYPGKPYEGDRVGSGVRSQPQQERAAHTVNRIQAATRAAAADTSPDQVTVSDIARRAAIHPRTFYRYFVDLDAAMESAGVSRNGGSTNQKEMQLRGNPEELRNAPQRSSSARTLERLLIAARQLIDETGVDRLTTSDVAARAGVSIGTFYRYFTNRVALLDALEPERHDAVRLHAALIEARARAAVAWEAGFHAGWAAARRSSQSDVSEAIEDEPAPTAP